jgi:threonine aldolase
MDRRHFLAASGLAAASPMFAATAAAAEAASGEGLFQTVNFGPDGLGLSPREYAARLGEVVNASNLHPDYYSLGGPVADIEKQFAGLLGKEAAMFVPTGTLANHLAVRKLAGNRRRVLVQAESHLYNDSGDAAQVLSGLNLIPLAPGQATLTLDEVKGWVERSGGGRVETKVGVIAIESPVRRRDHAMADFGEMRRISAWAREQGIRMHLDGARLFNLPLHSGKKLPEIAALFDTVYVSLWKHFNGMAGAVIAGDKAFIDGLFHTRRLFGGSLPQAWPTVALVSGYAETYERDYAESWRAANRLISLLEAQGRFRVRKVPEGTSRFYLSATGVPLGALAERAQARGIVLPWPGPDADAFPMQVNPTILRLPPEQIAQRLADSLEG